MKHHIIKGEYSYKTLTVKRNEAVNSGFNLLAKLLNKTLYGNNHVGLKLYVGM